VATPLHCTLHQRTEKDKFDLKFETLHSLSLFTPPSHRSGAHSISLLPSLKPCEESTTAATSNFAATARIFSFAARFVARLLVAEAEYPLAHRTTSSLLATVVDTPSHATTAASTTPTIYHRDLARSYMENKICNEYLYIWKLFFGYFSISEHSFVLHILCNNTAISPNHIYCVIYYNLMLNFKQTCVVLNLSLYFVMFVHSQIIF
jgi:hypothetical protein